MKTEYQRLFKALKHEALGNSTNTNYIYIHTIGSFKYLYFKFTEKILEI